MKTVFILIGAKGVGKSYVGKLIEKNLGIRFLLIEAIFIQIQKGRNISDKTFLKEGYDKVAEEIDKYLSKNDKIVIESTGAFDFFDDFLSKLKSKYSVKLIFLYVPLKLCLQRIKNRAAKKHIKMPDSTIRKVYKITNSLPYKYILKIDVSKQDDEDIIDAFRKII